MNETLEKQKSVADMTEKELEQLLEQKRKEKKRREREKREAFAKAKNDYLLHTGSKFKHLRREMQELKEYTIAQANELWTEMHEIHGKEPKDQKQITLKNEDDTLKVTVERQERFEFTEEATVFINAIRDRFKEKFAARNKGLYAILDGLLLRNSKKEYDPKLLAKARRQVRDLGDEELIDLFDKLDECQRVSGSSLYCRFYEKKEKGGWSDVSLQFSSL